MPLGAPGSSRIGPFSVSLVSLAWFPPYPFPWSDSRLIRFPGSRLILVRFSGPVPALSVSLVCFPPYPFPWFPLYPFPWSGSHHIRFSGLVPALLVPALSVSLVWFPPYPFLWAGSHLIRFPGLLPALSFSLGWFPPYPFPWPDLACIFKLLYSQGLIWPAFSNFYILIINLPKLSQNPISKRFKMDFEILRNYPARGV